MNIDRRRNIDIDRDIDIDVDIDRRGCCYYGRSGWGTAAAVATTAIVTAAVVGSTVNVLPAGCSVTYVNGFAYQQCGTVTTSRESRAPVRRYVVVNAHVPGVRDAG